MSKGRSERELGMPFGTASGRLKKAIMLSLVQAAGRDECFRCGQAILTAEELSIDHIADWRGVDPALFWDVGNIAFSHRNCNSAAGRRASGGGTPMRRIGPAGTAWCGRHRAFLPREQFTANASRWNGLHDRCRECRAQLRNPVGELKPRTCRYCSKIEGEVELVPRRLVCTGCYRARQRTVMRTRRTKAIG